MKRCFFAFFIVFLLLGSFPARADVCKAPFMHNQGRLLLTGAGVFRMGADLVFSDVVQRGNGRCQARVQGSTSFGFMGLPASDSELDYWMTIDDGKAQFESVDADGKRRPVEGQFDLRLLGLFAYDKPIARVGQTFDKQAYEIRIDKKNVDASPLLIRTGVKTVGDKQLIATAAGDRSCWPIQYEREVEAVTVSLGGIRLPLPGMRSDVTDWFCPELNMVMRQDSVQAGVSSTVEVAGLH